MSKQAYFFVDDVIWVIRDIARQKPNSIFDNPYMKMLKRAHDDNGLTVQLNLFYRTDFSYGDDEFTLSDMPDTYKEEFEKNSHWLKFSMHSKQELPDFPFVNMDYDGVKANFERIANEVRRFAGEKCLSYAVLPHWYPMSREGCHALYDCGVKFLACSSGDAVELEDAQDVLSNLNKKRAYLNRKKDTRVYFRRKKGDIRVGAICGYNHISDEEHDKLVGKNVSFVDEETGLRFKHCCNGPCLNRYKYEEIVPDMEKVMQYDYVGIATHEQYFYPEYYNYQPYYSDAIYLASKMLKDNGYTFIIWEDMK